MTLFTSPSLSNPYPDASLRKLCTQRSTKPNNLKNLLLVVLCWHSTVNQVDHLPLPLKPLPRCKSEKAMYTKVYQTEQFEEFASGCPMLAFYSKSGRSGPNTGDISRTNILEYEQTALENFAMKHYWSA